ncbi:hypothetical protein MKX03_008103 [Papaver bracteatum]|nr:hypothetical protein MKX03_008103 [Papaver bracteatum]
MARILISLVLILISLSQIAFAEDIKLGLGRKGAEFGGVERRGKLKHNLENGQVNLSGANNVVVAGGLVKVKRAGEAGTDLKNRKAFFLGGGSTVEVAGLVKTGDAENVGVNLPGKTTGKDASADNYHG